MKKCPFCAEMILEEAKVCRYCGRDIDLTSTSVKNNADIKPSTRIIGKLSLILGGLSWVSLLFLPLFGVTIIANNGDNLDYYLNTTSFGAVFVLRIFGFLHILLTLISFVGVVIGVVAMFREKFSNQSIAGIGLNLLFILINGKNSLRWLFIFLAQIIG